MVEAIVAKKQTDRRIIDQEFISEMESQQFKSGLIEIEPSSRNRNKESNQLSQNRNVKILCCTQLLLSSLSILTNSFI